MRRIAIAAAALLLMTGCSAVVDDPSTPGTKMADCYWGVGNSFCRVEVKPGTEVVTGGQGLIGAIGSASVTAAAATK